eukprot:2369189-Pyramimonas_sp.AAC.1
MASPLRPPPEEIETNRDAMLALASVNRGKGLQDNFVHRPAVRVPGPPICGRVPTPLLPTCPLDLTAASWLKAAALAEFHSIISWCSEACLGKLYAHPRLTRYLSPSSMPDGDDLTLRFAFRRPKKVHPCLPRSPSGPRLLLALPSDLAPIRSTMFVLNLCPGQGRQTNV